MRFRKRDQGDRRTAQRFDILGELWGTLQWQESWPLRNIGRGGAMVEGRLRLQLESVHTVTLHAPSRSHEIRARVRHVSDAIESGNASSTYLIGLEFLDLGDGAAEHIDELLSAGPSTSLGAGPEGQA